MVVGSGGGGGGCGFERDVVKGVRSLAILLVTMCILVSEGKSPK